MTRSGFRINAFISPKVYRIAKEIEPLKTGQNIGGGGLQGRLELNEVVQHGSLACSTGTKPICSTKLHRA